MEAQATPGKAQSPALNPSLVSLAVEVLDQLSFSPQAVDIEDISFDMGKSLHFKVIFGYEGKRCFLKFSMMSLGSTQINHIICDLPCARDECDFDEKLLSRLNSDLHEKKLVKTTSDFEIPSGDNQGVLRISKFTNGIHEAGVPYVPADSSEAPERTPYYKMKACCRSCLQKLSLERGDVGRSSYKINRDDARGRINLNANRKEFHSPGVSNFPHFASFLAGFRYKDCCLSCRKELFLQFKDSLKSLKTSVGSSDESDDGGSASSSEAPDDTSGAPDSKPSVFKFRYEDNVSLQPDVDAYQPYGGFPTSFDAPICKWSQSCDGTANGDNRSTEFLNARRFNDRRNSRAAHAKWLRKMKKARRMKRAKMRRLFTRLLYSPHDADMFIGRQIQEHDAKSDQASPSKTGEDHPSELDSSTNRRSDESP